MELKLRPEVRRLSGKAVGSRGSGKTLYAAYQTFRDFAGGVGSVVIDPMGTFTNYLFSRIAWSPQAAELWRRVVYVPLGGLAVGEDVWVVPTPFLYGAGSFEALQDRTQRVVDLWKRLNPQQENAPIQGMPSIERTADHLGMLLAAMGKQLVPDAARILEDPARWLPLCEAVARDHPFELAEPLNTVRLYADPRFSRSNQRNETLSFLNKIGPSVLNPRLSAQYGADAWGVDLRDVEAGKLIVFDCAGLTKRGEKRAASTWVFSCCMEYFRSRGPRRDVVGFVIDELSYLVDRENVMLEDDFEDLIARIGRNYGIATFVTYQQVTQPSERMQAVLDMVGYSLFGATDNAEAASRLVELLDTYRPYWAKSKRVQYAPRGMDESYDQEIVEYFSPQEQERLNQAKHRERPGLSFALARAAGEGAAAIYRGEVSIKDIKESQKFDSEPAEQAKAILVRTHGRTVADVLEEIEARMPPEVAPVPRGRRTPAPSSDPDLFADAPPVNRRRN